MVKKVSLDEFIDSGENTDTLKNSDATSRLEAREDTPAQHRRRSKPFVQELKNHKKWAEQIDHEENKL